MVSFSCEACGDVLTKKKLDPHRNRCHGATFTCIDCMVHFPGVQYRSHTSCMTEDQKYQGALYKEKSKKQNNTQSTPRQNGNANSGLNPRNSNNKRARSDTETMPHQQAYVEEVDDKDYNWADYEDFSSDDEDSPAGPPPEAPTPPSAVILEDEHVDVFDFLVATGQTPNASTVNLTRDQPSPKADAPTSTSLVKYERKAEDYLDPIAFMDHDDEPLVQYGSGPVPTGEFVTPAPKHERRKHKDSDSKKLKKRKRLHVDVPRDEVMTDAPPVLHSGLTGGLTRMMRPVFPPSPDYSGGDAPEVSPTSPMKKSKHSKHSKHSKGQVTHSIFGMIAGNSTKTKTKKRKTTSKKSSSHRHKEEKAPKLIEYRPHDAHGKVEAGDNQVVLFKPRGDVFLSFVNKGPDSERGLSMNKVLKRFHRERQASGENVVKSLEEKELWRSLRLRQNERGEIVLFSIEA